MPKILVGVGSNLGDREAILREAVAALRRAFDVTAVSDRYSYPAIGGPEGQHDFLNGAILAETQHNAATVCEILQQIEQEAGRTRIVRWSSRTLDCDLLLYGSEQIWTPDLKVPHPRMITRRFVLEPSNEIAHDMLHPESGWRIGDLFEHLKNAAPLFCVLGSDRVRTAELAEHVASDTGSLLIPQQPLVDFADDDDGGDRLEPALKWQQSIRELIEEFARQAVRKQPIVCSNWDLEPWLTDEMLTRPDAKPSPLHDTGDTAKLLIVLDDKLSNYGQRILQVEERDRIPALFLSNDPKEARQDAAGAVLAMTM